MREWNASLRVYLEAAKAAVENAERHASAAEILIDSGHLGPAAALAIIGQEETGKALLFTMIGFHWYRMTRSPKAVDKANHHPSKQQLALVGHVLAKMGPRIRAYVDDIPDDLQGREDLLRVVLATFIPVVMEQVKSFPW